jgi:hypothetical protein
MTRIIACVCGALVVVLVVIAGSTAGVLAALGGGLGDSSAGCLATTGPSTAPALTAAPTSHPDTRCPSTVEAEFTRAATWLTGWDGGPVPYLSSSDPTTWWNGYRRDCSGYVSMALGLPGPGLDTSQLAAQSTPITKADLTAGDLMINPAPGGAGHVVLFDHWTDTTMSAYIGYEQSGDSGTHRRVIPYPYFGTYLMSPYRYGNR